MPGTFPQFAPCDPLRHSGDTVSSRLAFSGSKRRARQLAAEAREVARVTRELQAIHELAPLIRDDAHLDQILAEVTDDDQRAAVRTLIEPFLRYRISWIETPPC
jgi:hypothetical protein